MTDSRSAVRFDRFHFDPVDRRLSERGVPVPLGARYLDALALLVAARGQLVTKQAFMDAVWRGVPVTDEALTQCIRSLRRALGDDAAAPRFIATVPKHGYRFVAPVEPAGEAEGGTLAARPSRIAPVGLAGAAGGGLAGLVGGLLYGALCAAGGAASGSALSLMLVLAGATALVGAIGGAGTAAGVAAARRRWPAFPAAAITGGAFGGLLVGALVRFVALDAFALLLGHAPADATGGGEGALLGAAVGAACAIRWHRRRVAILVAIGTGALAGVAAVLTGGHLMAGSLDLLVRAMPDARLSLAPLGALVGDTGFGRAAALVTAALEGALFVTGTALGVRRVSRPASPEWRARQGETVPRTVSSTPAAPATPPAT